MYSGSAWLGGMGIEDRVLLGLKPMELEETDDLSKRPGWQRPECDTELGLGCTSVSAERTSDSSLRVREPCRSGVRKIVRTRGLDTK